MSVSEIKRLLGIASWYRRFTSNLAIVVPINNLLHNSVNWSWRSKCKEAFKEIKEYLVTAALLCCPNYTRPFILQSEGRGVVLNY